MQLCDACGGNGAVCSEGEAVPSMRGDAAVVGGRRTWLHSSCRVMRSSRMLYIDIAYKANMTGLGDTRGTPSGDDLDDFSQGEGMESI